MMVDVILTGVDDSETAFKAAEKAAALAAVFGAELNVLSTFSVHMAETIQSVRGDARPTAKVNAYSKLVDEHAKDAERTALTVVEALRKKFPELKIRAKAAPGPPGRALLNEADELNADIIVVGNKRVQGRGRVLGSIAQTVASEANCDLYIVHTHQR
ncbi:universal stress protein [Arthrobacter sp. TMS1-12-1]